MEGTTGKLTQTGLDKKGVGWEIENIFSLLKEVKRYKSPPFEFWQAQWYLILFPYGETLRNPIKYFALHLMRKDSDSPLCVRFLVAVKAITGDPVEMYNRTTVFTGEEGWGTPLFLMKSRLLEKRTELAPSDVLTIVCYLERYDPNAVKRVANLSRDLQRLMNDERNSDVTIYVEGEAFKLHRNILGARVPVFDAMFQHDMIEKKTGTVTIPDCKASTFRKFLEYVYTGTVTLSAENVFDLYELANKYQVEELKWDCLCCIENTLTVDTFHDAIVVAMWHNEEILIRATARFFSKNMSEIMKTAKWQNFLKENPIQANELTLKALAIIEEGDYECLQTKTSEESAEREG